MLDQKHFHLFILLNMLAKLFPFYQTTGFLYNHIKAKIYYI